MTNRVMSRKQFVIIISIAVLLMLGSFFYWSGKWRGNTVKPIEKQSEINNNNNNLTHSDFYQTSIAVVVDNFPETRPQSGLSKADVIYETVTEGGITRFLAVYKNEVVDKIGPIRSARTYFAEIADEWGAIFAHVGGNSDVLKYLKEQKYSNLINLDQFFWEDYFERIGSIKMPHNVFSSTEVLNRFLKEQNKSLKIAEKLPVIELFSGELVAKKVKIDFLLSDYLVEYNYNEQLKSYERKLAGKPHIDAETNKVLDTQNIIIQYVKTWDTKTDTPFSISMDLESGGEAVVFSQGKVTEGTWKKTDRTRYYNSQGVEIAVVPGKIWVELVPKERKGFVVWQ